jgi:hypothetical protein
MIFPENRSPARIKPAQAFSGSYFARLTSEHSERRTPSGRTASVLSALGGRDQAFALSLFPGRLARSPDRLCFLSGLALGRLFIGLATLHLAKNALALQLPF